jgi:hypothetical protein
MGLICLIVLLLLAGAAYGQSRSKNIFISSSGNDKNSGLTIGRPLQTICAGLRLAVAGDTVYVLPGIYHEKIRIDKKKGLPEKYIYLYGYPSAEKPVIDGGAPVPAMNLSNNWIECSNAAWIETGNLVFKNGWTDPVRVENSSYISFKHCDFYGGRKVILATGAATHHVLVEHCSWNQGGERLWTIEKDSLGVDAWLSMHHQLMGYYNGSLVDSRASGGSFVIRDNYIQNAYNGIRFTSKKGYDANVEIYNNTFLNIRDNDVEPEHYVYNMHIYHNRSHNIHKTMSVDAVAGGYIYYYGNTVTMDSSAWAKKICTGFWKVYGGEDSLTYPMNVFNNSFFGYGKAFNVMEARARQLKHCNNAYFFDGEGGWVLNYTDKTNVFDYDLSNKPWSASMVLNHFEQHGKIGAAGFINQYQGDLRLSPNSPAIDAGRKMAFEELGWTQTYEGKAPDIGAYEDAVLVDGPAFRFRVPEGAQFNYQEKPRIVKYRIEKNKLLVYFSAAINAATLPVAAILLQQHGEKVVVERAGFPRSPFELIIETGQVLEANTIALAFKALPAGRNGQAVTYWASAIPVAKQ